MLYYLTMLSKDESRQNIIDHFHKNVLGKSPGDSELKTNHKGNLGHWLESNLGGRIDADGNADLNGYEILVGVTSRGYFAVENNCPHQNKPLCGGRIRHGHISCPVHGMRFNLETGAPVGQLTNKSIKVYEARANGDWLEVGELGY